MSHSRDLGWLFFVLGGQARLVFATPRGGKIAARDADHHERQGMVE